MLSSSGQVAKWIEDCIKESIPLAKPSPHFYDPSKLTINNKNVFSVKVGSFSNTAGTMGSVTVSQNFPVELIRTYNVTDESDIKLRESIDLVSQDHETLLKRLSYRNSPDIKILVVSALSGGEPQIEREKKYVSLEVIYTIQYRKKLIRE